jgi:hypothetical protein
MVVDCVDEDDALKRGNRGFNSVVKVRFLHSRIRLHLLKKSRKRNNLGVFIKYCIDRIEEFVERYIVSIRPVSS